MIFKRLIIIFKNLNSKVEKTQYIFDVMIYDIPNVDPIWLITKLEQFMGAEDDEREISRVLTLFYYYILFVLI